MPEPKGLHSECSYHPQFRAGKSQQVIYPHYLHKDMEAQGDTKTEGGSRAELNLELSIPGSFSILGILHCPLLEGGCALKAIRTVPRNSRSDSDQLLVFRPPGDTIDPL